MICPRCSMPNDDNQNICCNCGHTLHSYPKPEYQSPEYRQGVYTQPIVQGEKTLVFNIIYAIILFFNAASMIPSMFYGFIGFSQVSSLLVLVSILLPICKIAYDVTTGVLLLKLKKAGNIMRFISNIFGLLLSGLMVFYTIFFICIAVTDTSDYAVLLYLLAGLFGFAAVVTAGWNIFLMIYYKKNKHRFK